MKLALTLSGQLTWLFYTLNFIKKHYTVILTLGLVAAFSRVIQLGGFGEIPRWLNIVLEVVVESARIILFLYVLGLASINNGLKRIKHFMAGKINRKLQLKRAWQLIKHQWPAMVLNVIGFLLIAAVINYLINLLAYETCLYLTLKKDGILAGSSSEWTILLFFKNLSVIPFTLAFEAMFLLWVTGKFNSASAVSLK